MILPDLKWYEVTIKFKGRAESAETAKKNCKLRIIQMTGMPENYIETIDAKECLPP
jgi:hypothetical protein